MKLEGFFISGLAIRQTGGLLGIPKQKFNPEARPIEPHNFRRRQFQVGGEQTHRTFLSFDEDHPHATFERDRPENLSE